MKDNRKEAIRELQENSSDGGKLAGVLVSESNSRQSIKLPIPPYWKKKRLSAEFLKRLQDTAQKEPVVTDEHGEYKDGVFLHGCVVVEVSITEDLWSLAIHSEHFITLPMIQAIRYKYIPDSCMMAYLFSSRKETLSGNTVVLYQIPGSLSESEK
jgi:hypothetical protein